jgi:hypothetical protein
MFRVFNNGWKFEKHLIYKLFNVFYMLHINKFHLIDCCIHPRLNFHVQLFKMSPFSHYALVQFLVNSFENKISNFIFQNCPSFCGAICKMIKSYKTMSNLHHHLYCYIINHNVFSYIMHKKPHLHIKKDSWSLDVQLFLVSFLKIDFFSIVFNYFLLHKIWI